MRICRAREKKNRDCTTNRLYYIVAECQIAFIASHLTNEVLFRVCVFIVVVCFTLKFIVFTRAQMMIVERNKHFEEEEANKQKNRNTE